MKNQKAIIVFFLCLIKISSAQQLGIEETMAYLNEKLGSDKITLENDGTFSMTEFAPDVVWKKSLSSQETRERLEKKQYNLYKDKYYEADIRSLNVKKDIFSKSMFMTQLVCKSAYCISKTDYRHSNSGYTKNENEIWIIRQKKKDRDKIFNAFKYLLSLVDESDSYRSVDDDPFANENFNDTYSYITGIKSSEEIQLERSSGIFYINVQISGFEKKFVLDSGASELSLSKELERELIARGIIKKEDYLAPALYRIADGSIVSQRRVLLKEIKVGDFIINNITASVGGSSIPLLLGKSFLDKFSKWTIDNNTDKLLLEK